MARPRKVLVVPSWYPSIANPTAGIFIREQVRALSGRTDVAVLHVDASRNESGPKTATEDGVIVIRAGASDRGLLRRLRGHIRVGLAAYEVLVREWGTPDIIHVQALWPAALIARAIKRRYGIPYVVTEHSEEYLASSDRRLAKNPLVVRGLLRPLALGASRTITVSEFLANRLVELRLAVGPIAIPNVVPVSPALPLSLELPHVVSHVSIMGPAKNLETLLRAVDKLHAKRLDFRLRLVGDGECRPALERTTQTLDLNGYAEFTGRKSTEEVRELLATSAFTVVSSTHETFSVSAAESLMCGRPVLSTRCGGPEEFITPEVGYLVDAGSVDALVQGLDWMLDHFTDFDPQVLHEYALARFSPDVVAKQILAVYREVLGG